MIFKIFSVYDNKAKAYLPPFVLGQVGQAVREFAYCSNDKTHQFGRHPEDYTLTELGTFDDESGDVQKLDQPVIHGSGQTYLQDQAINGVDQNDSDQPTA